MDKIRTRETYLAYPEGGWTPEVPILNVNAGETVGYKLSVPDWVYRVLQPCMVTEVGPYDDFASVYTVTGNDGTVIDPYEWLAHGGFVAAVIGDPGEVLLSVTGATGLRHTNYSLALPLKSGGYVSTLRLVGTK